MVWVVGSAAGFVAVLVATIVVVVLRRRARIRALRAEYRRRWGEDLRERTKAHEAHEHEMHRAIAAARLRMAEYRRRLRESKKEPS